MLGQNSTNLTNEFQNNNNNNNNILPYMALVIIFIGLVGNTNALLLFITDREIKKMPSMIFLSFTCVTNTLS
jgi:hypothetical protein